MSTLVAILALALLFVAFGLLRPAEACNGHCESCSGSCPLTESDNEQH
jgi:hypothetical protein